MSCPIQGEARLIVQECLFKVDQRSLLVDKLSAAYVPFVFRQRSVDSTDDRNRKRLLHPGAETKDVITQYISTIRSLRILDPPGVLLHKIAEPIRKHLRERPDTIKCIVGLLVEGEDLNDENEAGGLISEQLEGVERFGDPRWDPEPVDAAPGEPRNAKSWWWRTLQISLTLQNSGRVKRAILFPLLFLSMRRATSSYRSCKHYWQPACLLSRTSTPSKKLVPLYWRPG